MGVKVHPLPPEEIRPPPPGLLQAYLSLAGRLEGTGTNVVTLEEINKAAASPTASKQLAHMWTKHSMAVRLRHGHYALVNPSVVIRAWAVPAYYGELLTLDDALTRAGIAHAFACLTAGRDADYVPERPFLVLRSDDHVADRIAHFTYKYPARSVSKVRLDVLSQRFHVPALAWDHAAIILASTSLPREVRAAKQLLAGQTVTDWMAVRFNALGLRTRKDVYESEEPGITLPAFIEERRRKLAEEALKEGIA